MALGGRRLVRGLRGGDRREREAKALERKHAATQDMIAAGELPDEIDARRTVDSALDASNPHIIAITAAHSSSWPPLPEIVGDIFARYLRARLTRRSSGHVGTAADGAGRGGSSAPFVPDGVFVDDADRLVFALHPVPTSADVVAILDRIVRRIARRLAAEARDDAVDEDVDVLAQVQAEAAATWRSPREGNPTVRGVERLRAWCVTSPTPSLHVEVVIADHDRAALERLCRYGARPAFAHERLAWTAEGQIAYRLKRPWPDGRTHLVLPPVAFLRRLCGTIPPRRRRLVRYAGVFGPAYRQRAKLRR